MGSIIKTSNLWKRYGKVEALKGVNFSISQGSVLGVLGPNGAGKTTLIMILCGLRLPTEGKVELNGIMLKKENRKKIAQDIGIVFQENSLDLEATIKENLMLHGALFNLSEQESHKAISDLSKQLKLKELMDRQVRHLSHGQRQRVEIAKALLHKPKILFFDEPTVGLDVDIRKDIWAIIKFLAKEKKLTIFITSHYLEEIEELCERVVILNKGKIVLNGDLGSLQAKKNKELHVRFENDISTKKLENELNIEVKRKANMYYIPIKDKAQLQKALFVVSSYSVKKIEYRGETLEEIYLSVLGEK